MKLKKDFCLYIIIILIIVIAYELYNFAKPKRSNALANGYYVYLSNFDKSQCNNQVLKLNNNKFNYIMTFTNSTNRNTTFLLTTYIDYMQTPFSVKTYNAKSTYTFNLNSYKSLDIPIKIDLNNLSNGTHILNFIIYKNPNTPIHNPKESIKNNPIITKHDLILKGDSNISLSQPPINIASYKSKSDTGSLILNSNKNGTKNSIQIKVKHDQMVSIPIVIGSFKNINNYLFWITLNQDQILFDNKFKYLFFNLPQGHAINEPITFKAPHTKGTYKLTGFLSLNPFIKESLHNLPSYIRPSIQYTLIVN